MANLVMTLRQWQQVLKPREQLLFNCSECTACKDNWVNFPIGMGNSFVTYSKPLPNFQIGPHNISVLCAVSDWTDEKRRPNAPNRRSILAALSKKGIQNIMMDSDTYFDILPSYQFVISPEGNGIDCHRTYEALIAGCIPIVEDREGIRKKYEGCPVLYTKDYSEITPQYLTRIWNEFLDYPWDFTRLILGAYPKEIQEEIKKNGNYWGMKLRNKAYYEA